MAEAETALIVGAGPGLSASLARKLAASGRKVALAARNVEKLAGLVAETGARAYACDVAEAGSVAALFEAVAADLGAADIVVFNPSARSRGPIAELVPEEVLRALTISAYGGFLVGREAARAMEPKGRGTILFTGASASVKGYPLSAPFAMGKFALRGLAQSMARELGPKGIHVAHVVIDGGIRSEARPAPADAPMSLLDPDAIAETYMHLISQHPSAWTFELEVRPHAERF